jgi:hypothetical protein
MNDIELRFVERDWRDQLDTYTAIVRKIKVLQCRYLIRGQHNDYFGEWQDVPLEVEEE